MVLPFYAGFIWKVGAFVVVFLVVYFVHRSHAFGQNNVFAKMALGM